MAEDKISSASFEAKNSFKLPEGATITRKNYNVSVREIENGYIIRKSYDIKYTLLDSDDDKYEYYSREWFSKTNPLEIKMTEPKSLADSLD